MVRSRHARARKELGWQPKVDYFNTLVEMMVNHDLAAEGPRADV